MECRDAQSSALATDYARTRNGKLGSVGRQVGRVRRPVVTYFLGWYLDPEDRANHEKDLIGRYLDGLAARGISEVPSIAEAFELHRAFMVDAWNSAWAPLAIEQAVTPDGLPEKLIARFTSTLLDLDTSSALRVSLGGRS